MDFPEIEDNNSVISENDIDFTANEAVVSEELSRNYPDKIDSISINYNPINIHHNSLILGADETTKWIVLWAYFFQDTFTLS